MFAAEPQPEEPRREPDDGEEEASAYAGYSQLGGAMLADDDDDDDQNESSTQQESIFQRELISSHACPFIHSVQLVDAVGNIADMRISALEREYARIHEAGKNKSTPATTSSTMDATDNNEHAEEAVDEDEPEDFLHEPAPIEEGAKQSAWEKD